MRYSAQGPDEFFLQCMFIALILSFILALQSCSKFPNEPQPTGKKPANCILHDDTDPPWMSGYCPSWNDSSPDSTR